MNNVEAVRATLYEAMKSDDRTLILGEDVGARGNVFLITKDFISEFGERRVIDTPIAEASIVGIAVGMAMEGLRPIAEIQFADFIYPSFNQIVGEAAKIRYRSNGEYTCPLVIRTPYGGGVRGALSHSVSIEALFYHVPGLKIVAPSFPADVKGLLNAAIDDPDPVLFLEHKKTYRLIKGEVPNGHYTIPLGKANVLKEGTQLTVVSYGLYVHWALEAAQTLEQDGLSVEVIDLRSIRPMDKTTILRQRRKDAQAADHSRRQQVRRHRRGDQRDGGRRGALSPRRADPASVRSRRSGDGLRAAARGRVHVVAGRDGRSDARDGEVLDGYDDYDAAARRNGHRRHRRAVAQERRRQRRQVRRLRRSLDRQGQRRRSVAGYRNDSRAARQRR